MGWVCRDVDIDIDIDENGILIVSYIHSEIRYRYFCDFTCLIK